MFPLPLGTLSVFLVVRQLFTPPFFFPEFLKSVIPEIKCSPAFSPFLIIPRPPFFPPFSFMVDYLVKGQGTSPRWCSGPLSLARLPFLTSLVPSLRESPGPLFYCAPRLFFCLLRCSHGAPFFFMNCSVCMAPDFSSSRVPPRIIRTIQKSPDSFFFLQFRSKLWFGGTPPSAPLDTRLPAEIAPCQGILPLNASGSLPGFFSTLSQGALLVCSSLGSSPVRYAFFFHQLTSLGSVRQVYFEGAPPAGNPADRLWLVFPIRVLFSSPPVLLGGPFSRQAIVPPGGFSGISFLLINFPSRWLSKALARMYGPPFSILSFF